MKSSSFMRSTEDRRGSIRRVVLERNVHQSESKERPRNIEDRRQSTSNPFMLPEYDEEAYDPQTAPKEAPAETVIGQDRQNLRNKVGAMSFKKIAKAITKQRKWSNILKDMQKSDDYTKVKGFVANSGDGQERLSFNVNAFKPHVQSCGVLPVGVKQILRKNSFNRSEEEVEIVLQIAKKMKCFDRYPMYVKRELAKVLYHDEIDKGRIVIKQGHIGTSFYFIVSGSVIVERVEEDKNTGEQHTSVVGEMSEGDAFGELALLHNIRRTATIICKERSEFLRVDKQDFDQVLKNSHQIEWERKLAVLTSQPILRGWNLTDIRQIVAHTKLREYPPNTVILGDISGPAENIYFIQSGKCQVVREMTLYRKTLPSGKSRLTLPPIQESDIPGKKLEKKFLAIHVLKKGDYFGVGEDLTKTYILSVGRVHCVLISHLVFRKRERGRTLEELKQKLCESFPTPRQAFRHYIQDMQWKLYKKSLVDDVVRQRKRPHRTTFHDVPVVVRTENAYYLDKLWGNERNNANNN